MKISPAVLISTDWLNEKHVVSLQSQNLEELHLLDVALDVLAVFLELFDSIWWIELHKLWFYGKSIIFSRKYRRTIFDAGLAIALEIEILLQVLLTFCFWKTHCVRTVITEDRLSSFDRLNGKQNWFVAKSMSVCVWKARVWAGIGTETIFHAFLHDP